MSSLDLHFCLRKEWILPLEFVPLSLRTIYLKFYRAAGRPLWWVGEIWEKQNPVILEVQNKHMISLG